MGAREVEQRRARDLAQCGAQPPGLKSSLPVAHDSTTDGSVVGLAVVGIEVGWNCSVAGSGVGVEGPVVWGRVGRLGGSQGIH